MMLKKVLELTAGQLHFQKNICQYFLRKHPMDGTQEDTEYT